MDPAQSTEPNIQLIVEQFIDSSKNKSFEKAAPLLISKGVAESCHYALEELNLQSGYDRIATAYVRKDKLEMVLWTVKPKVQARLEYVLFTLEKIKNNWLIGDIDSLSQEEFEKKF